MSNPKIDSGGNKRWYNSQGQRHREDGPAVEYADGSKTWWLNGQLHREDGPAVEFIDGYKEWWFNGIEVKEKDVIKPPMVRLGISPTSGLLKMVMERK